MSRISRFAVEFTLPDSNKVWLAEFTHQHAISHCQHVDPSRGVPIHVRLQCSHHDGKGRPQHRPWECPEPRKRTHCPAPQITPVIWQESPTAPLLKLQHLTRVKLRYKGQREFLSGYAPCSLLDTYHWQRGIHLALQRALEKGGYCTLRKVTTPEQILLHGRPLGAIVVEDKKPIYDAVMEAFWREMRVLPKAVNTAVLPREDRVALVQAIDAKRRGHHDIPHGLGGVELPPENMSGLGWAGCD